VHTLHGAQRDSARRNEQPCDAQVARAPGMMDRRGCELNIVCAKKPPEGGFRSGR
jgi:hypothetical protein